jgi:ubiquinone/menaquinone biosynthesis C-methylase UbiE
MNGDAFEAKQLYDKQAALFSNNQTNYVPVQEFKQKIYSYLGNLKDKKVLFVGCANGYECIPVMQQGAQVTGIDISDKLIESAQKNYPQAQFFVMDQAHLSFPDNSFDMVISLFTVMYTQDLEALFREFNRVIKKEGKIIIAAPHPIRKMVKYNAMNYFVRGRLYENWRGVDRFGYYRLIEDYVDALVGAELKLHKLMEPQPVKESETSLDADISHPYFLVLVLVKD